MSDHSCPASLLYLFFVYAEILLSSDLYLLSVQRHTYLFITSMGRDEFTLQVFP